MCEDSVLKRPEGIKIEVINKNIEKVAMTSFLEIPQRSPRQERLPWTYVNVSSSRSCSRRAGAQGVLCAADDAKLSIRAS